jgi:ribonucleoside-diphosphate reductase beta chain|tara:strand:+ start:482 stop:1435 length:954 start_codon:yes stop_codon:yes gene_type:complete
MSLLESNTTYKPFKYPWAVTYATEHERIHWIEDELELQTDINHWKSDKLTANEKNHITQILRLFTQSDVAVGTNYLEYYIPKFKNNEIRAMLTAFASREFIHQRAYALLNDTLGLPEEEFTAFLEYSEMADKVEFMSDIDVHSLAGTGLAIARSVLNEGVSLFSAFAMLLNYQRQGKMPGMCTVVEWSVRDESQHAEGMAKLFRAFTEEHPRIVNDEFKRDIFDMFRMSVRLEDKVIDLAYELGDLEGLSATDVKQYIRYLADRRLIQLGLKPNWKVKDNPLPWMEELLGGSSLSNFFEKRVTDYNAQGLEGEDWGW